MTNEKSISPASKKLTEFLIETSPTVQKKKKSKQKTEKKETPVEKTTQKEFENEPTKSEAPGQKEKEQKRSRKFSCISYIDAEKLKVFLSNAEWLQHYAFITHDKDVWTEADEKLNANHKAGTIKEKHSHVILYTYSSKTSSAIRKLFDRYSLSVYGEANKQNTTCQICHDASAKYRYLTHKDNPEKPQYNDSLISHDDINYWQKLVVTEGLNDVKENTVMAMINDYLSAVPFRDMVLRYGRDFVYHFAYIRDMAHMIDNQEKYGVVSPVDKRILKVLLSTGNYNDNEIRKFFDMLDWIGECYKVDYNVQPDFSIYFSKEFNKK